MWSQYGPDSVFKQLTHKKRPKRSVETIRQNKQKITISLGGIFNYPVDELVLQTPLM